MGVAGTVFEQWPWNFGRMHNFWRCLNDITTIFWISQWFLTYQKALEPSSPDESKNFLHKVTVFGLGKVGENTSCKKLHSWYLVKRCRLSFLKWWLFFFFDPRRQFFFCIKFWFFRQNNHFLGISPFFGRFASCITAAIEHLNGAERVTRISQKKRRNAQKMVILTKESKNFIKAKLTVSKSYLLGLVCFMIFCILRGDLI